MVVNTAAVPQSGADRLRTGGTPGNQVITYEQIQDSLQLFREHNDRLGLAKSYERLGKYHQQQEQPAEAVAHYLMAGKHYRQVDKTSNVIEIYHNVAALYRQKNHFDEAIKYASRAHQLASKMKNDSLIAISSFQLGRIYEELGQHRKAEQSYQVALDLFQRYDKSSHIGKYVSPACRSSGSAGGNKSGAGSASAINGAAA